MNRYKMTLMTASLLVLTACGGGGGGSTGTTSDNTNGGSTGGTNGSPSSTSMNAGEVYTIEQGGSIVKQSDPTVVILDTSIETGVTTVTLQSGSANIEY